MEKIGVVKKIDRLERLVIPKSLRDRYGINKEVELIATKDGILVRNPEFMLVRNKTAKNNGDEA